VLALVHERIGARPGDALALRPQAGRVHGFNVDSGARSAA
jgi:hypothetical protein